MFKIRKAVPGEYPVLAGIREEQPVFTKKAGFVAAGRSGKDGCGKPYPLIHMVIKD